MYAFNMYVKYRCVFLCVCTDVCGPLFAINAALQQVTWHISMFKCQNWFLSQSLTMSPWLAWKVSPCRLGYSHTSRDLSVSVSQAQRLRVCTTMPSLSSRWFLYLVTSTGKAYRAGWRQCWQSKGELQLILKHKPQTRRTHSAVPNQAGHTTPEELR